MTAFALMILCGAGILVIALCGGSEYYTPFELLEPDHALISALRLRRIAGAFLIGAALASGGTACQAVLHNDLAEPYILGVSGGAGVGAAVIILLGLTSAGGPVLPLGAFAGAVAVLLLVLLPSRRGGSGTRILLSGVVAGSLCSSILMLLISIMGNTKLNSIVWWLLGNLEGQDMPLLLSAGSLILASFGVMWTLARETNALSAGADFAHGFGVSPGRVTMILLGCASLASAAAVSLGGIIGFVGLIVPHIARRIIGFEHRKLYPASFLLGGFFLVLCDLAARSVYREQELPAGVVTALLGGPFFLYLLYRRETSGGAE